MKKQTEPLQASAVKSLESEPCSIEAKAEAMDDYPTVERAVETVTQGLNSQQSKTAASKDGLGGVAVCTTENDSYSGGVVANNGRNETAHLMNLLNNSKNQLEEC